jgi:hypothetical protein
MTTETACADNTSMLALAYLLPPQEECEARWHVR